MENTQKATRGVAANRQTTRVGLLVLSVVATSFYAPNSEACSPPIQGQVLSHITDKVPADGGLVAHFYCSDCDEEQSVNLIVETALGETTAGTLVESEVRRGSGYVVWVPETPFQTGESYTARLEGDAVTDPSPQHFTIVPAPDVPGPETLPTINAVGYANLTGDTLCCEDSELNSCGTVACMFWPESGKAEVRVSPDWYANDDWRSAQTWASQHAFRGRYYNADQDVTTEWMPEYFEAGVFAPGDEYCYELYSRHLVTGTEALLTSACISGTDIELPNIESEIAFNRETSIQMCTVPPQGYEEEWCDAYAGPLSTGDCDGYNHAGCAAAQQACEPPTLYPDGNGNVVREGEDAGGCQLIGTASSVSWHWAAGLALMALGRRRRTILKPA